MAVSLVAAGIALEAIAALATGAAALLVLCAAIAEAVPTSRRARNGLLEFAWWRSHAKVESPKRGHAHTGRNGERGRNDEAVAPRSVRLHCLINNPSDVKWVVDDVTPLLALTGAKAQVSPPFPVPPRKRTEFSMGIDGLCLGPNTFLGVLITLRGLLGLVKTPLYFPSWLVVELLPTTVRATRFARHGGITRSGIELSPMPTPLRQGGGMSAELRDRQPGDPLHMMAWRATLRTGRLTVRKVESFESPLVGVALDESLLAMRSYDSDAFRNAAIACALDVVGAQELGRATVLAMLVHGEVRAKSMGAASLAMRASASRTFLHAYRDLNASLWDLSEETLYDRVGRYLLLQEGLDLRGPFGRWDQHGVERALNRDEALGETKAFDGKSTFEKLKGFCEERGLPIPVRHIDSSTPDEPSDAKVGSAAAQGVVAACREMLRKTRGRSGSIHIVIAPSTALAFQTWMPWVRELARRGIATTVWVCVEGSENAEAYDALARKARQSRVGLCLVPVASRQPGFLNLGALGVRLLGVRTRGRAAQGGDV